MGYDAYVHIKKKYTKSAIEKLLMLMKYEKMGDAFYCGNDKEYKLYTGVYVWMCDQNKEEWVKIYKRTCYIQENIRRWKKRIEQQEIQELMESLYI